MSLRDAIHDARRIDISSPKSFHVPFTSDRIIALSGVYGLSQGRRVRPRTRERVDLGITMVCPRNDW